MPAGELVPAQTGNCRGVSGEERLVEDTYVRAVQTLLTAG